MMSVWQELQREGGRPERGGPGGIQAFETFFDAYPNQDRLLAFVRDQLSSDSPKTRKAAKAFLEQHQGGQV